MQRVTEANLKAIVDRINRMQGTPENSYKDGKACVGNYHLSHAYGGVALHQMTNESGGCRDVINVGHVSKRELQSMMFAYIQGLSDAKAC
jgi:hypothetical protein